MARAMTCAPPVTIATLLSSFMTYPPEPARNCHLAKPAAIRLNPGRELRPAERIEPHDVVARRGPYARGHPDRSVVARCGARLSRPSDQDRRADRAGRQLRHRRPPAGGS